MLILTGPMKKDDSRKVIIVGGGMSGLTAARLLEQAGQRVTIIEGSNRVGGRVWTFRDPSGWIAELGAIQVPVTHILGLSLVANHSLRTAPLQRVMQQNFVSLNGLNRRYNSVMREPNPFKYNLHEAEKNGTFFDKLQIFQEKILDVVESRSWSEALEYFDKFSIEDYLLKECKFSLAMTTSILHLTYFHGMKHVSMYEFAIMMFNYGNIPAKSLVDGLDSLPSSIASNFKKTQIQFNSTVEKVTTRNNYACVHYKQNGHKTLEIDCADYVIVTTALGALKQLKIRPKLNLSKREAIKEMNFESATRVVEKFSKPFWESYGIKQGDIVTDWSTGSMNIPRYKADKTVLYGSLSEGSESKFLLNVSDIHIVEGHLDKLSKLFKFNTKSMYQGGIVKKWLTDPLSKGGFTACRPSQCTNNFKKSLQEIHGRIHFAGEHTSDTHGWIEGAVESGIRVFIEISEKI